MKYETADIKEARKLIQMFYDSWVAGPEIEGTSQRYRAEIVRNKCMIENILDEVEKRINETTE